MKVEGKNDMEEVMSFEDFEDTYDIYNLEKVEKMEVMENIMNIEHVKGFRRHMKSVGKAEHGGNGGTEVNGRH